MIAGIISLDVTEYSPCIRSVTFSNAIKYNKFGVDKTFFYGDAKFAFRPDKESR